VDDVRGSLITKKESKMTKSITVKIVNVYGNERIYPVCDIAHSFSFIANTKTLSRADIKHIKDIGFEIVVEGPTL
jgi:hypothetical protein|tara:strand:- start:46 stop:270 length:225 start_codon:yes stop_codon:yes gene_type:complete